ncbi:unnamed protein product [Amaranthus hypochondriacus]
MQEDGAKGKSKVRKGAWSEEEDDLLRKCIQKYGEGSCWKRVPQRAGLNRCRKSCRWRWLNYIKPGINREVFSEDEIEFIAQQHKLLGNRWSLIAAKLPGRTINDVKNFCNTEFYKEYLSSQEVKLTSTQDSNVSGFGLGLEPGYGLEHGLDLELGLGLGYGPGTNFVGSSDENPTINEVKEQHHDNANWSKDFLGSDEGCSRNYVGLSLDQLEESSTLRIWTSGYHH